MQTLLKMGQQIPLNEVIEEATDLPQEVIETDVTFIKEHFEDTAAAGNLQIVFKVKTKTNTTAIMPPNVFTQFISRLIVIYVFFFSGTAHCLEHTLLNKTHAKTYQMILC